MFTVVCNCYVLCALARNYFVPPHIATALPGNFLAGTAHDKYVLDVVLTLKRFIYSWLQRSRNAFAESTVGGDY